MRSTVLLLSLIFVTCFFKAQTKSPFLFRLQEKRVSKHIHKCLPHDTLISTTKAKIHIHYSKAKNKPYLLLLHGMGVDAKTNWYRQVSYLSKDFNLLMPDLVYFGKSVATEDNYSVEFQAEQIHETLQKLNIHGQIHVMGFSYGGLTAAVYNQLYPQEVNKLIIIDGPVKFFSSAMADSLALRLGVASMSRVIVPQNSDEFTAMQKAVLSRKIPMTRRFKNKFIRYYFSPTLASRQLQLNYLTQHQSTYQNYDYHLDETPVLLIWGAKDGVVPLSVGIQLHEHHKTTSTLIVYKKAKHDAHFRNSKKLNKAVARFLTN